VCDTRQWIYNDPQSASGWLDVKVVIEIVGDLGASDTTEVILSSSYYYYAISDYRSPMLVGVTPNAISSEDALVLNGVNFGYWLQDYRTVYVGTGAPPQGGNVKTAFSNVQTEATHAVCRPEEVRTPLNSCGRSRKVGVISNSRFAFIRFSGVASVFPNLLVVASSRAAGACVQPSNSARIFFVFHVLISCHLSLCFLIQLNTVRNPAEPDLPPTNSAPVLAEDRDPEPIAENILACAVADFPAGSYNVSVFLDNYERSSGNQNSASEQAGLAIVYDNDNYLESSLFSRDASGILHMVFIL